MLALVLLGVLVAGSAPLGARDNPDHIAHRVLEMVSDASTHWKNQSGSTMDLEFSNCSNTAQPNVCSLSGTYVNNAAGYKCQGTPYPLVGSYYINTQTLSWTVAWSNAHEDCASVTGWTGYIDLSSSPLRIVTKWNLAYSTGGSGRAIMPGEDVFVQTGTVVSESLLADPGGR
ncbi:MAG: avidin/streptavidin family protein [Acidobacteriota bacterium]